MFTHEEISDEIMRINAMIKQRGLGLSPSQQNALRQDGASLNVRLADFEAGKGSWNAVSDAFTTFSKSAELVFGDEPVGATPVPAPAAPTPPTAPTSPSSGTSKWAPSQATPPVSPTPAPSPAPASDDSVAPAWFTEGIVPLTNQVRDHESRIARLEKAGFDWLVAAFVATGIAIVAYIVMTQGQHGDILKTVASLAIGAFVGWIVGAFWAGIKSRRQERSSRNAA